MPRTLVVHLAIALTLLGASTSWGFSPGGHRVIAEIAWRQLDESSRKNYVSLIKQHPRFEEDFVGWMPDSVRDGDDALRDHWIFLEAACWADYPSGYKDEQLKWKYRRGPWHYINFPTYLSESDADRIDLSTVNRSEHFGGPFRDQYRLNIIQAIKANWAGLRDENRTSEQRAIHLCWVMHLLGDSHQPLHSTALFTPDVFPRGCRGGNEIDVDEANLHSIWDGFLGRDRTVGAIEGRADKYLQRLAEFGPKAAKQLDPAAWLHEGHEIAETAVFDSNVRAAVRATAAGERVRVDLPEEYLRNAGRLCQQRAVQAGFRLAAILDAIEPVE